MNAYGFGGGDRINFSDPMGLCAGPFDLVCTATAKPPGVLGSMLAGIGKAAEDFWAAHGDAILQTGLMLVTEGMSAGKGGLSAGALRGKSMQQVEEAIPSSWTRGASNRGGGTRYMHPTNRGEQIRVQPGDPSHYDPMKQGPYCVISSCGKVEKVPLKGNPTLGGPPG